MIRKSVFVITAVSAMIWAGPALAVYQETSMTVTDNGNPVPGQTVILTEKHKNPQIAHKKPTIKKLVKRKTDKDGRIVFKTNDRDNDPDTVYDITLLTPDGRSRTMRDVASSTVIAGGSFDFTYVPFTNEAAYESQIAQTGQPASYVPSGWSSTHFGLFLGGTAITDLPTESTSHFYRNGGVSDTPTAFAFGGSFFKDLTTFGNAPGPFGSYVLSAGVVLDYSANTQLNWNGLCGGMACTGAGRMNEFNYIGELKLTTPIGSGLSANGYVGAGGATMWPSGMPTGEGGPSFQGNATAWAFRVGGGVDQRINENWSVGAKVGFQTTGPTDYDTTLDGERFHIARKNEVIFGSTVTYTPSR
jgi:hypothetical protein